MYVPLRCHGWHSLLTGVDEPVALLRRAREVGCEALALTDVDTLSGLTEFLSAAEAVGVRPIVGAELSDPAGRPGRIVALVESAAGYRNLCRWISARRLGDDPGSPGARLQGPQHDGPQHYDPIEASVRFHEGLFLVVDHPRLVFALARRLPAGRLFVALSPAGLSKRASKTVRPGEEEPVPPPLEDPKCPPPARAASVRALVESARVFGLATLAVPDVHYAVAAGARHHRVRVAIKHNALSKQVEPAWVAEDPAWLMSPAELERAFADTEDQPGDFGAPTPGRVGACERTQLLAERCRFVPETGGVLFPAIELEAHETAYSRLCQLALTGAQKRYPTLRPEVLQRLDRELSAIEDLGFAPYFLLVHRIAEFARAKRIPCVGRGSAADSLVAYSLGLTDADPLRYRLPFERFLNPTRADRPDIDLDFCWRRRDEVLAHVWEAFGAERTAMIATLNRFGLRAAFREAALAAGVPPVEVNRWSRRLPRMMSNAGSEATGIEELHERDDEAEEAEAPSQPRRALPAELRTNPIAISLASTPECRDFPFGDARMRHVLDAAAALIDAPRHLGLHPGGVVVAPGAITDVVSCQRATKGVVISQLDKDGVEALGLVKMDLLGNRALTILAECRERLAQRGIDVDLDAVPEDDPETARTLAEGRTLGCFQVESPGMRNLLQQTAARTMDDVIQAVALIRPGPAGAGIKDAYIRRFRGEEVPEPPHPLLAETLAETQGVLLYQEDVMQVAAVLAGMSLGEADALRRALAKRRGDDLVRLERRFREGARARGVADDGIQRVWENIARFASFGFCKAHAVTYGRIAYRAVYLKTHWPAEYLVSFLNSQTGYYDTRAYVEEARRSGLAILPPDVNKSDVEFELEEFDGRTGLRVGLDRVRGLSHATLERLLDERRRNGAFLSLPSFLARSSAAIDEVSNLIQSGAFDAFDRTRPEMLWRLHLLRGPVRRAPRLAAGEAPLDLGALAACQGDADSRLRERTARGWSGPSLGFGASEMAPGETRDLFPPPETPALALPPRPEFEADERARLELHLLGLTIDAHPASLFPCEGVARAATTKRRLPPRIPCNRIASHAGRHVSIVGWLTASRRVMTENGRWMRFLSLEDASGLVEVNLFPDVYERDGHRLTDRGPFLVSGRAEDQLGAVTLRAERVW
ncbi:MAG: DNA polymerase III subunit alpha [Planctomycetota bacterium]